MPMGTFLFDRIIFGPVYSRRLGHSLGLNLLPTGEKVCSFNCIYCECGWTDKNMTEFVSTSDFRKALEQKLQLMKQKNEVADTITFAGNGEPTLHSHFAEIVDITVELRNIYMPFAEIAVLSNSTTLNRADVVAALLKTEKNIMKLDAGSEEMFRAINQPLIHISLDQIVEDLQQFNGKLIIQTLLVKGRSGKKNIDNLSDSEIKLLGQHLGKIKPHTLMLYSIARGTPLNSLQKVTHEEIEQASEKLSSFIPDCKILIF